MHGAPNIFATGSPKTPLMQPEYQRPSYHERLSKATRAELEDRVKNLQLKNFLIEQELTNLKSDKDFWKTIAITLILSALGIFALSL